MSTLEPFVPNTTPTIERANRLISLKAHPGFLDLLQISKSIVDSATAVLVDYGGWDPAQISVLKVRAQAAKEHHELLIAKMMEAIREGVEEDRTFTETRPEKTASEVLEQGDFVRQKVMEKFESMDLRVAGSY